MRLLLTLLIALFMTTVARAATGDWLPVDGAKMRLIGMPATDGNSFRAGLQIELEPGWKTYWRNPGGSGLPPQLDFSASINVDAVSVAFPAPVWFPQDGSIGYKERVTFPISLKRPLPFARSVLNVTGLVGICADICIPTPIQLSLAIGKDGETSLQAALVLNEAESRLPKGPEEGFSIESVALETADAPKATIEARVPATAKQVDLFVEGPSSWYLTRAEETGRDGTIIRFSLDLQDAPKSARLAGQELKFTLVADGAAIEQNMVLTVP